MADMVGQDEPAWLQTVNKKRKARDHAIAPFLTQSAAKTDDIITSIADVEELAARVAKREFSTYNVVSAYIRKYVPSYSVLRKALDGYAEPQRRIRR